MSNDYRYLLNDRGNIRHAGVHKIGYTLKISSLVLLNTLLFLECYEITMYVGT